MMDLTKEIENARAWLSGTDYAHAPLHFDGTLYRFYSPLKQMGNDAWIISKIVDQFVSIVVADWCNDSILLKYQSDLSQASEKTKLAFHKELKRQSKIHLEEKESLQAAASMQAKETWATAQPLLSHPYLEQKNLSLAKNARTKDSKIIVPIYDIEKNLTSLQFISETGKKFFLPGGKVEACFTFANEKESFYSQNIIVCEGWATGHSLDTIVGDSAVVVCALSANNLKSVCAVILKKNPFARIVLCADNDHGRFQNGVPDNTGLKIAHEISTSLQIPFIYPSVKENESDYNDLLTRDPSQGPTIRAELLELFGKSELLPLSLSPSGAKIPTEAEYLEYLLAHFKDKMCVSQDVWFKWSGTHWARVHDVEIISIITKVLGKNLSDKKFHAVKNIFSRSLEIKENLFLQKLALSFQNGTLYCFPNAKDKLVFKPTHHKEDYLLHSLSFDFPENFTEASPEKYPILYKKIAEMWGNPLENGLFSQNEEILKALRQMFGGVLFPLYPKLFLFIGPGATGKSTFGALISQFLNPDMVSHLDPTDMKGFMLESLVGKSVNINMELNTSEIIPDHVLKKVEDAELMEAPVKFKQSIKFRPPRVHIYAANELPRTRETSNAYVRRWCIFNTTRKFQTDHTFLSRFLKEAKPELLWFAIHGLIELLEASGKYFIPKMSMDNFHEWELESDSVKAFVDDVRQGEFKDFGSTADIGMDIAIKSSPLHVEENLWIERHKLYAAFRRWAGDSGTGAKLGKIRFYSRMKDHFQIKIRLGRRGFTGIGYEN